MITLTDELMSQLLIRTSEISKSGDVEVVAWIPPQTATSNPAGILVTKYKDYKTGSRFI